MTFNRAGGKWLVCIALVFGNLCIALAQCPGLPTSSASGNSNILCEGAAVTFSATGVNLPVGSDVDWYLFTDGTQNPYNGEGTIIGTSPVTGDPCNNPPEVLYVMVNPDNAQVGGPGDQCDEFMVLWTGSGGFSTSDILVTNLGPGTFQWNSFVAGNAGNFSCAVALPPGPVPANAILIIQSSPNNNVPINSDELCASGLPVYIIAYDGTGACTGGYFDNNSPCSSCPVMIDITGSTCQFDIDLDYQPPGSSVDGWAWANTGSGVFADVIPPVNVPTFDPPAVIIDDFVWTVPSDFCETLGGGDYWVAGIPNPPPGVGCPEIITSYFGLTVSCPEASLSGGGDVCEGNCPDNPTLIEFELVGNDLPFEADLVFMASGFPPFPINDLSIPFGYHIQVCLGGGIFPSFDPGTGILTVPSLAIGITATVEIVSMTSDAGCPVTVDPSSISITFIAAPTADAGPDAWICDNEVITLNGSIGGSATDFMWSTTGDGTLDDPNDLNSTYTPGPGDFANGEVEFTLTAMDANGSCLPAESTVLYTIYPLFTINVGPPQTVCSTDIVNLNAVVTGPPASGFWYSNGDGVFEDEFAQSTTYTPGPFDIMTGSVVLHYGMDNNGPCTAPDVPLFITIVNAPLVNIPQGVEVCAGDEVDIQIGLSGNYSDVTWSTTGDGTLMVINDVLINYSPGPNDIANHMAIVSVSVVSGFAECGTTTYNIIIDITDCNCPDLETIPPTSPLCATSGIIDLDDLLIAGDPGNWAIISTPPGSNPALLSGSQFIVNNSDAGSYVVSYNVSNPQPGCPASSTETIVVNDPIVPEAGPDETFCGPDTIVLSGIYTPLDMLDFLWVSSGDGIFSDNTSLNTSYYPGAADSLGLGVFVSLHVLDTVCGEQIDTMNAFFNAAPFATFVNDTVMICDATAYGSVLNFTALITSGDNAGFWTNIDGVPVNMSNPAAVDFNGIAEGYYAFGYRTNSAAFPCAEKDYVIYVHVESCSCPLLVLNNPPAGICNDLMSLPLDAFVMAGAPGTWQILSTPVGSNPATLTGSVLNVNGVDQGDYRLRFTFNAAPLDGCVDSTEFTIFIQEVPSIDLGKDTIMCNDQILDLFPVLGSSAISVDWSATDMGMFSADPAPTTSYSFSTTEISGHNVFIYGTSIDTFGFCPQQKDTLKVQVIVKASITWSQLADTICNNSDSGSVVDFRDFILHGDINPNWLDVDNSGANRIGGNRWDFDGVVPGVYVFRATTNNSVPPCGQESYDFIVTVIDCNCPPILLSNAGVLLCEAMTFDLSTQIIDAGTGSWSVSAGPAGAIFPQINGSQLNTTNASAGDYIITYTLTDSLPGCPASANIALVVEVNPTLLVEDRPCDDSHNYYSVILTSDAGEVIPDFGVISMIAPGKFQIDSIPAGQDVNVTMNSDLGACSSSTAITAPNCNCTLMIEDLVDTLTLCPGDSFRLIPFVTGAAGFPTTYWISETDTVKWFSFEVSEPGTYIWVVIDTLQCEERDTFTAVFIGPTGIDFTSIHPTCPNETDGSIIINDVINGLPPYSIQLDNQPPVAVGVFPHIFPSVGLGQHIVALTDLTGCTFEQPVTVSSSSFGTIDLGPDITITKGDSTYIQPEVINIGVSTVQWNLPSLSPGLNPFWIKPDSSILLQVTVTDTAGCIYSDEMTITVIERTTFYIPNIFSPNDDQINDQVIVNTNIPDDRLVSFEIFDRWGGMLHRQVSNPPFSWDGKHDGKKLNPGVYVYKLVYKDERDNQRIMIGDITLIR